MRPPLTVIMPKCPQKTAARARKVLQAALINAEVGEIIEKAADLRPLKGARILFVVAVDDSGINKEYCSMLKRMRLESDLFTDCLAAVIVDGQGELYTKSVARDLVFAANRGGCAFIGRPLVEGIGSLANFLVLAQATGSTLPEAYLKAGQDLVERLLYPVLPKSEPKNLLVLHASSHKNSNTYGLWGMVKQHLPSWEIREIGLRNGALVDCSGCPYTSCLHFGDRGSCLYGGVMVDEVYPAVEACQAIILLCPNYNDALPANLTAFINRLTALFRRHRFYDKALYGLVVSGYSGGDIIAGQLIAALNMNKSFFLPPRFCMLETANNAGDIFRLPGIEERARLFACKISASSLL